MTGGASGIGCAISAALVGRGDDVVVADLDGDHAAAVGRELTAAGPGSATAAALDVRDSAAMAAVVEQTADRHGRLDLMVNNVGIDMGGDTEELTLAHWERVVDINLRGVVHGVEAAYPLMVRQGFGHLVNTASIGGLIPEPTATPYAATKHAVAGLSASLRCEAADRGVKVSVVCPGVIDTPIFERDPVADLPAVPSVQANDVRAAFLRGAGGRMYPAERLAADVLAGIDRNKAVIVAPRVASNAWGLARPVAEGGAHERGT